MIRNFLLFCTSLLFTYYPLFISLILSNEVFEPIIASLIVLPRSPLLIEVPLKCARSFELPLSTKSNFLICPPLLGIGRFFLLSCEGKGDTVTISLLDFLESITLLIICLDADCVNIVLRLSKGKLSKIKSKIY